MIPMKLQNPIIRDNEKIMSKQPVIILPRYFLPFLDKMAVMITAMIRKITRKTANIITPLKAIVASAI